MKRYLSHFNILPTNTGGAGDDTTGQNLPAGETFTKAQVEALLATETNKIKKERSDTVAKLEALQKSQALTQQQKNELAAQIEQLQSLSMSKEEIAKQAADRQKKQFDAEKNQVVNERDYWQNQYREFRLETEIRRSAAANKAYNDDQLVELLMPKSKLIEQKVGEGEAVKTIYQPIVKFTDRDADGKTVSLELPIADAIKRMRELPEVHGNLFSDDTKGGTGLLNQHAPAGADGFRPDMTMTEYEAFRAKQGFGVKVK